MDTENENLRKFNIEYKSELQKISPEMYDNKKFDSLLQEIADFLYDEFNPSWTNRYGEVTRSSLNASDYYFNVSEDGKRIIYGYSKSNPGSYQNGYNRQFICYGFEIVLNKYDNLVVTSKGGSYDEDIERKNDRSNTYMSYNGRIYDTNGNMIKNISIDKITTLACTDLDVFVSNINYHHCPDFSDPFRPINGKTAGRYAGSSTMLFNYKSVERNMSNPSIVHYIDATRRDGRDFDTTYFAYPESFWTIQLDSQFPDRLNFYPSIPEEYKHESADSSLYEQARIAEANLKQNNARMYL